MKRYIVLLCMTASMLMAQPQWMDDTYDDDMGPMPDRGGAMMDKLNLTDKQESQMKEMRTDLQKRNIELRAKIQTMRLTLRDEFESDEPNQNKIESQMTEISKLQNELKLNATSFWFKVNKMLTPDQQKLWKEHRAMMQKRLGAGKMKMKHQFGLGCGKCDQGDRKQSYRHRQNDR